MNQPISLLKVAVLALLTVAGVAQSRAQELVVGGDFESGAFNSPYWTVNAGTPTVSSVAPISNLYSAELTGGLDILDGLIGAAYASNATLTCVFDFQIDYTPGGAGQGERIRLQRSSGPMMSFRLTDGGIQSFENATWTTVNTMPIAAGNPYRVRVVIDDSLGIVGGDVDYRVDVSTNGGTDYLLGTVTDQWHGLIAWNDATIAIIRFEDPSAGTFTLDNVSAVRAGPSAPVAGAYTYINPSFSSWGTAGNWNPPVSMPSNTNLNNVRWNINQNGLIYSGAEGSTILDVSGTGGENRAVMIANQSAVGSLSISGGALTIKQEGQATCLSIGVPSGAAAGAVASLTLSGGDLSIEPSSGFYGQMSVPFRGDATTLGTLTVGSGSTLTSDRILFGDPGTGGGGVTTGCAGQVNLNSGGTIVARNFRNLYPSSGPGIIYATNNFNGGTLVVAGPEEGGSALIGTDIAVNLLAGGVVVDTVTNDARIIPAIGGMGGITKVGSGTLDLGNAYHNYTGPTRVNAGTLKIEANSQYLSSFTFASGTGFEVTQSSMGGVLVLTALTNSGSASYSFALNSGSPVSAIVPISGNLHMSGNVTVNVSGIGYTAGTYDLLTYSSRAGAGTFVAGALPVGASLNDDTANSRLTVTFASSAPKVLAWSAGSADWDAVSFNWFNTITFVSDTFASGDLVAFDDNGFGGTVTITAPVAPGSLLISNTFGQYVFTGQPIGGTNGLLKLDQGPVTLASSNSYSGVTLVRGIPADGYLYVADPNALGDSSGGTTNGTVVSAGATVALTNGVTVANETLTIIGSGVGGSLGALRGADTSTPTTWAGPVIVAGNGIENRVGTEDNAQITLSGPITDGGAGNVLLCRPGSNGVVRINSSGNQAGILRSFGGADMSGRVLFGAADVFPETRLEIGAGSVDLNGFDQTFSGLGDGAVSAGTINTLTNSSGSSVAVTFNQTNTSAAASYSGSILGAINLVKTGAGVQVLGGTNAHTGTTTVNGGVLRLASTGLITVSPVEVNSGGQLWGGGTLLGPVSINNGGRLSPGASSIATLTVSNTLTYALGSTNVMRVTVTGTTNSSRVVADAVNYGGTLYVINTGANPLSVGDEFQLYAAGVQAGTFDSVVIESGEIGTFNPTNGVLTVTGLPAAPQLNYGVTNGVFTFSWSGGFKLQYQTNGISSGLGTSWMDYPDTGNPVDVTVDPGTPAVFFRLISTP